MTPSRKMLAVAATADDQKKLEELAIALGYRHGAKPNVSAFIRAIAAGELIVSKLSQLNPVPDVSEFAHPHPPEIASVRRPLNRHRSLSPLRRQSVRFQGPRSELK